METNNDKMPKSKRLRQEDHARDGNLGESSNSSKRQRASEKKEDRPRQLRSTRSSSSTNGSLVDAVVASSLPVQSSQSYNISNIEAENTASNEPFSSSNIRPQPKHSCPICNKQMCTQYSLRSHLLTHTDECPYVCPFCTDSRAFTRQSELATHLKKSHPKTHFEPRNVLKAAAKKYLRKNASFVKQRTSEQSRRSRIHEDVKETVLRKCKILPLDNPDVVKNLAEMKNKLLISPRIILEPQLPGNESERAPQGRSTRTQESMVSSSAFRQANPVEYSARDDNDSEPRQSSSSACTSSFQNDKEEKNKQHELENDSEEDDGKPDENVETMAVAQIPGPSSSSSSLESSMNMELLMLELSHSRASKQAERNEFQNDIPQDNLGGNHGENVVPIANSSSLFQAKTQENVNQVGRDVIQRLNSRRAQSCLQSPYTFNHYKFTNSQRKTPKAQGLKQDTGNEEVGRRNDGDMEERVCDGEERDVETQEDAVHNGDERDEETVEGDGSQVEGDEGIGEVNGGPVGGDQRIGEAYVGIDGQNDVIMERNGGIEGSIDGIGEANGGDVEEGDERMEDNGSIDERGIVIAEHGDDVVNREGYIGEHFLNRIVPHNIIFFGGAFVGAIAAGIYDSMIEYMSSND
ncbi:unnamed protein product [Orchesella dallaii]|uniref:C2H2-type domain-containing protein n=1 Tax=Orchesella dallaii TaxID=48710 RepID=A0ABP1PSC8_9HEXA